MSDKNTAEESKQEAPAMKADESAPVLEVTSHETAETTLADSMKKAEALRAALLNGEAAKDAPDENEEQRIERKEEKPDAKREEISEGRQADEQTEENESEKKEIDWKAEAERVRAEQRRKDGIHGSELEKLRRQIEVLTGQLGSKQEEAVKGKPVAEALAKAEAAKQKKSEESYEPTEDELIAEYGPNYEAEVGREWAVSNLRMTHRKLAEAKREMEAQIAEAVQRKLEEVKFSETVNGTLEAVEAAVPGAREIDANAETNGFAEYLDAEDPQMPGFTRREVADRLIVAIANKSSPKSSLDRLIGIYAGFTGKEPKNPAGGAKEAMREKDEKSESREGGKEDQPDKKQYVMPTQRGTDKNPSPKSMMTVSSFEEELRKSRGGNFDGTLARLLEKVRAGEVISG